MISKRGYSKLFSSIIRQYTSSKQQTATTRESVRSFFVRLINDHRKKIQQNDIRLEPYKSKGVYTITGAIRPMPRQYPHGFGKVLLTAILFIYLGFSVAEYAVPILEKIDFLWFLHKKDHDHD